ncbi:MAG: hypothetical protein A3B34_03075 [Candidatus Sungbacteria bacterium RIFCSPLOWO2_01_FULL_54_21]|uniref:Uncharacterized protein n=1 Tax=Candidatus Sungbacteria bacterium RIFCSPLOWO2_01_FULL_54_21 TaxID=1802279 RepID=A0A1G2L9C1_9BACT|nr:MAG: hypothetical protein A2679_03880 [Candidatus Sungbacteria bacterium RIFCSPHIGHO2_01_FULL_54_26]OHA07412.1 MAG: hypothetical protein A3B34_03075 [Candidatus Sungbacteria bacterium RIFCSPLOWO2_01_FULL_54_21]
MTGKDIPKASIVLTRRQFLALLKAVYLGNWVANAYRDGGPLDPLAEEYEGILHLVFSQAPRFGLEKYASREPGSDDAHHPTRLFEEGTDVRAVLDAHEDAVFWEELAERLGERDFHAMHTEEMAAGMAEDESMHRHHESIDRYEDEFANHGIDRLRIAEDEHEKGKDAQ